MERFKNFEDFLLEREISTNVLSSPINFLRDMLFVARKDRVIKNLNRSPYRKGAHYCGISKDSIVITDSFDFRIKDKLFSVGLLSDIDKKDDHNLITIDEDLNPAKLLLISDSIFSLKEIDDVIPEKVTTYHGNMVYTFTRKVIKDRSSIEIDDSYSNVQKPTSDTIYKHHVKTTPPWILYSKRYIYFEYTMSKTLGESVTFDMAKNSQAFKDFIENHPVKLVSTATQLKKGTIVFGIPIELVIDPGHKVTRPTEKYLSSGYGIYKSGYIRAIPMWDYSGSSYPAPQPTMIGKFNAATLKGWDDSFNILSKQFKKLKMNLEKNGIKLIMTSEERNTYRGLITGHKYGI